MMPVERQRRIVELVNGQGSVRVTEISELFDVTPETVRRDLDTLEQEGKLKRSHGGAVRPSTDSADIPYLYREETHVAQKFEIAKLAAGCVMPGDRIALDPSSTALFLARALPDIPLTVLTNSVRVVQELSHRDKIDVISTGGMLRSSSMSFVGPLAEETLEKYRVNKAFLSCKGVDPVQGVSESNEWQALVKRRMQAISDQTILLADHSKFGVRDFTFLFDVHAVDILVTDAGADEADCRAFREIGVEVVVSDGPDVPL